jgi:hypothetical protein
MHYMTGDYCYLYCMDCDLTAIYKLGSNGRPQSEKGCRRQIRFQFLIYCLHNAHFSSLEINKYICDIQGAPRQAFFTSVVLHQFTVSQKRDYFG